MDIQAELLREHSKRQMLKIARHIGHDPKRFAGLMKFFFHGSYTLTQRASWVVSSCTENHPHLIKPFLKKMLEHLQQPGLPAAVKRNTVRILQSVDIPSSLLGIAVNCCFRLLASKEEAVAVKVFAMTVLFNISQREPGLRNELRVLIEEQLPYASPAFTSRGRKILNVLRTKIPGTAVT